MMLIKLFLLVLIFQNFSCEESYYIKIGDKEFPFTLKDTAVANELKAKFPLEVDMTNLNGNEIYYNFDSSFTTNTKSVGTINIGDIYLYQSNVLVLFYKTFTTSYSYTKIGKVIDPNELDTLIGSDNTVEVQWFIKKIPKETSLPESKSDEVPKDSSSNKIDSTQASEITSDTKTTDTNNDSDDNDNDNDFDNYGFQSFIKLSSNYIAMLFLAVII
jgi:hypothetical protein